jgi:hypothetical protein
MLKLPLLTFIIYKAFLLFLDILFLALKTAPTTNALQHQLSSFSSFLYNYLLMPYFLPAAQFPIPSAS